MEVFGSNQEAVPQRRARRRGRLAAALGRGIEVFAARDAVLEVLVVITTLSAFAVILCAA